VARPHPEVYPSPVRRLLYGVKKGLSLLEGTQWKKRCSGNELGLKRENFLKGPDSAEAVAGEDRGGAEAEAEVEAEAVPPVLPA